MGESTAVRRIRAGEGARWRELRLRALGDCPVAFVETVEQASRRAQADWDNAVAALSSGCQSALFIAERADEWVGVAGGFTSDNIGTTIFSVFIDAPARGQGILEALLDTVTAWSLECGRDTLTLEVAVQNPRAHAAYCRLGFSETGRSHPHPLYPEVTEVEMTRPAAPPHPA